MTAGATEAGRDKGAGPALEVLEWRVQGIRSQRPQGGRTLQHIGSPGSGQIISTLGSARGSRKAQARHHLPGCCHFCLPAKPASQGSTARTEFSPCLLVKGRQGLGTRGPALRKASKELVHQPAASGRRRCRPSEMRNLGLTGTQMDCFQGQQAPSQSLQAQA